MTLVEIFNACCELGDFPKVRVDRPVRYATDNVGFVTEIRSCGVAVQFPGMAYSKWFFVEDGSDGRKGYMKYLTLVEDE